MRLKHGHAAVNEGIALPNDRSMRCRISEGGKKRTYGHAHEGLLALVNLAFGHIGGSV